LISPAHESQECHPNTGTEKAILAALRLPTLESEVECAGATSQTGSLRDSLRPTFGIIFLPRTLSPITCSRNVGLIPSVALRTRVPQLNEVATFRKLVVAGNSAPCRDLAKHYAGSVSSPSSSMVHQSLPRALELSQLLNPQRVTAY
jgi:hypothetical protein